MASSGLLVPSDLRIAQRGQVWPENLHSTRTPRYFSCRLSLEAHHSPSTRVPLILSGEPRLPSPREAPGPDTFRRQWRKGPGSRHHPLTWGHLGWPGRLLWLTTTAPQTAGDGHWPGPGACLQPKDPQGGPGETHSLLLSGPLTPSNQDCRREAGAAFPRPGSCSAVCGGRGGGSGSGMISSVLGWDQPTPRAKSIALRSGSKLARLGKPHA